MALTYFRFATSGHYSLLLKWLPWIIGSPMRIVSFAGPLALEVLGLLWWGGAVDSITLSIEFCLILPYVYLIFSPNRCVFSTQGLFAAFFLFGESLSFVVYRFLLSEEIAWVLWVHVCFGVAWMLVIYLVMTTKPRPVPS